MLCLKFCVDATACAEKIQQLMGCHIIVLMSQGAHLMLNALFRYRVLAGTYFCVRIKALA